MADYIALAVPFFFLFIAVELLVAWRQGRTLYQFPAAIADLGCGITQRVALLFFDVFLGLAYVWIYRHGRIVDLDNHPVLTWVVAFIGVDLLFYWWHRASHRINVLWAAHIVHHQSEAMNLAVALRQSILTPLTAMPFALPMAFLGVPPLVYGICSAISTLYQFWIHTEVVRRLGPLEAVLNTPSHHRVHHASNPAYLDRNYGAIFIVWDRLFGTFAAEHEPPRYGITKPLRSFNPLWAQVQSLFELGAEARAAPSLRQRIGVWLAPPERLFPWRPTPPPGAPSHPLQLAPRLRRYVLFHFTLATVATFLLMLTRSSIPLAWLAPSAVLILATLLALAGLMESRPWARRLETARLFGVVAMLAVFLGQHHL
jgi:alkylglycerol monooxygenase